MMRSGLLPLVLVAVACGGRTSRVEAQFDGQQALAWVRHQVEAGPRIPNTPGHRAIGDWLEHELRQRADSVEVQAFVHVTQAGDTLHLRNFIARFRVADPSRVLYVTHWDTRPQADQDPVPANRTRPVPGANDGASGTAVLLGVADVLKRSPPAIGVDLVFVDAEDYSDFSGPDVLIGSTYFAAHLPAGYRPIFGVLWDMVGGRSPMYHQEAYSLDAAPEVVERVWRTAREIGLERTFVAQSGGYITDDHVPLIRAGLRVVDVINDLGVGGYAAWHTTGDTPDKLSAQSLADIGRLALALVR